jgi:hypothetical protein
LFVSIVNLAVFIPLDIFCHSIRYNVVDYSVLRNDHRIHLRQGDFFFTCNA